MNTDRYYYLKVILLYAVGLLFFFPYIMGVLAFVWDIGHALIIVLRKIVGPLL